MSDTPQQPGAGRAILEEMRAMEQRIMSALDVLQGKLDEIRRGGGASQATSPSAASDADLDGQYGNPEVKKNPPRWQGESCVGRRYSECPVEFLDEMAGFQSWAAGKEDAKAAAAPAGDAGKPERDTAEKNAWYARQRAGYARGWAARLRAGWKPPGQEPAPPASNADGHGGW